MKPSLTPLRQLAAADYAALLQSGQLWTLYPNATGDYKADTAPMKLYDLYSAMSYAYQTFAPDDARQACRKLYAAHFQAAIMAEGFTEAQARIIEGQAYDDGHSGGSQEIVNCAMSLCDFARKLISAK